MMPFLSNAQDLKLTVFNSGGPKTSISVCKGGAWAVSEPLWGCQWLRRGQPGEGWRRRWVFLMEPGVSPRSAFGLQFSGIRAGAVRALQSCGSLAVTHNHHEMVLGCPERGSAGTWQVLWFQITEEHRHEITTDKTLQKYPWPGPE